MMMLTKEVKPIPYNALKPIIVVHSSSHLGEHRGVVRRLRAELLHDVILTIQSKNGGIWDKDLIINFNRINKENEHHFILHIILLGDNDVRKWARYQGTNPAIKEFGETLARAQKDSLKNIKVFVNGLIPFPIPPQTTGFDLRNSYHKFIREMTSLVDYCDKIQYVPMVRAFNDYCILNKVEASKMFLRDKVHLAKNGEEFLIRHIVSQVKMFIGTNPEHSLKKQLVDSHCSKLERYRQIIGEFVF